MTPDPNGAPPKPADSPPEPAAAGTMIFQPDTATGGPPHHEPGRVRVGEPLGRYTITALLGEGGMGMVLKARDPQIERDVAIKVLADRLASDPTSLARFLAEARAGGKVNHPNVVAIYEIGQEGPTNYLALEYVAGGSLADRVAGRGPLPVLEATRALIDACRGVGAAHAAGLVHRDIKPANFMVAADGTVKVADFGLAKAVADTGQHLTQTGTALGTPFFMSPEQCEAKPVDHRTDLYSLGATYYSLLTGKHPFHNSSSVPQLMYAHCHGPVPDPRADHPAVPEACARIVARAMAKAPADRYQSADEMLADLQAVAATLSGQTQIALPSESGIVRPVAAAPPPPAGGRGRRMPVAVGGLVVALAGAALLLWRPWAASRERERPEAAAGAAAAPAGEPVKVGVLHSLSGTMATSASVVVDATLFAVDEVNQAGGVLGRPVKAEIADGGSDWSTFAREAERLITQEQVCTIFGCWASAGRKTVKPVVEAHDHLLLYPVQYEGLETSPAIVYLGAAPNQQIIPAVEWAVNTLHKRRFFLVGSDYVFPRAANAIIKDHLKRLGAEVAGEAYLPLGSAGTDAAITAIVGAKPDMILNTINGDSNIAFFRDLRRAGVAPAGTPTLSFSISEQTLRSLGAGAAAGDYSAYTYFQSIDTPENRDFVRRFHDKFPQRVITDPMETAYVGVKLWAAAVTEAQSLEPKRIRRALLSQHVRGPGGDVRVDPDTQHCYRTPRIAQVQPDGQLKVVWAAAAPVRPDPYPSTRTAEEWRAFLHDLYAGWGNQWAAPAPGR
ncbi:MAG TPA: transporter substrate-binding protein [Gemmataceae bacterium]|jgi:urea transport system substrate-binding protein